MFTPAIIFENDELHIIDQTLLPGQRIYLTIRSVEECIDAIQKLRVRGAPAIGICAAYGLFIAARLYSDNRYQDFVTKLDGDAARIYASRPTAVNLGWAVRRIQQVYQSHSAASVKEIIDLIRREAIDIHQEDIKSCTDIGYNGLKIVPDPARILTHCNTGSLATGGWGTALGVIYAAKKEGYDIHVYVDETRPVGQGARLTFWELMQNDIPCTLITDSMAGSLMQLGKIDLVLFGADRIAANGDVANKIGSYSLAALSAFHRIPCYAVAPFSTFDLSITTGDMIEIEQRNSREILHIYGYSDNLSDGADVYNPAFDVTPAELLSGIITEKGIIQKPIASNLATFIE